jgi:hypothetical protein
LPPQPPVPTNDSNTSTSGTHRVLQPGTAPPPGKQTPAQLAGLRPPVPGEKPPGKKH